MNIPFLDFTERNNQVKEEVGSAFQHFFDSKWYVLGEQVNAFEKEYAAFNQTKHAIGISNGLDALHIALKTLGVGEGDEVIIPSNTFIASVLAISYVGATPVFVEPNIRTYNLDPNKIEAAITSKTKAIIPVHLYGQCCDMAGIMDIAQKHNLFVIEDNAQAQGATWDGKLTGSFGHLNATSFYPGKNLGALGDAGGLTCNETEYQEKAAALRNYGSAKKYYNQYVGFNNRLDECQATFLRIFLKHLPNWNRERNQIANWYYEALSDIPQLILPFIDERATSVFHLFVIRTQKRDELQAYLKDHGVGTLIHYPVPPHMQECYADLGLKAGDFPIAEEIADTCLSLPIFLGLTKEKINYIATTIRAFFNE